MSEKWDRLPNESAKAYSAFCAYRDYGPNRSLENIRQIMDKPPSRNWLGKWSSKYNWVERVKAYDDYMERLKRAENEKAILDMVDRHARLAVAFQQRIAQRLAEINPSELTPADMVRWLEVAAKLERLSRGVIL